MNDQMTNNTMTPVMTFRSTSTMIASGSNFSSTPSLDADGRASMNAMYTTTYAPSGPRKGHGYIGASDVSDTDLEQPIGDGTGILIFFAMLYVLAKALRGRLRVKN